MHRITLRISAACIILILSIGCGKSVSYHLNSGGRHVRTGIEKFVRGPVKKYKGRKAALVTNHSGYDFDLHQNIQLLRDSGVVVSMILAPEHGIYGYKNDLDYKPAWYDRNVNCYIYNLFGVNPYTLRYLIQQVDVVIFDIQDMGMRCYTYISNLKDIMDVMDGLDRELIVLDRPNPVGFLGIDGSFLEKRYTTKYVSAFPAPFLYDMTIGEAARYYQGEHRHGVKLKVIPMSGYSRGKLFHETGLPWIPPSPNLPTYESSIVYTAIVLMEGINLSIGRGTTKPFEYIGAPWIDPVSFCKKLDDLNLRNFRFKPVYFKPTFSKYANMRCGGVQIFYTGGEFSSTETAYRIIGAVMKHYPYLARWVQFGPYYDIDSLAGTDKFRVYIQSGKRWEEFKKDITPGIKEYKKKRRKYLLY